MVVYGRKGYASDCRPPRRDMDRVMNVVNKIMHSHSLNISATMMRTGNGHWTWRGLWGMGSKNGPLWKWIVCGWPKASSTIIKANWDDLTISQCFIYSRVQICYFAQSLLFSPCPCPVVVVAFGRSKWTLSYRSAMTDSRDTDGWMDGLNWTELALDMDHGDEMSSWMPTGAAATAAHHYHCAGRLSRWTEFININIMLGSAGWDGMRRLDVPH